jgi:hypothetical protein
MQEQDSNPLGAQPLHCTRFLPYVEKVMHLQLEEDKSKSGSKKTLVFKRRNFFILTKKYWIFIHTPNSFCYSLTPSGLVKEDVLDKI